MEAAAFRDQSRTRQRVVVQAIALAAVLPLVGLVSLLLRSQLDPHIENYRLHFVVFGIVGLVAFALAFAAGEAANRRGDARVLLLSLAFMTTGGFMGLHALGTPGVLFTADHSGFAAASAFVDVHPAVAPLAIRHRRLLRVGVLVALAAWFAWTVTSLPPLDRPNSEAARGSLLAVLAIVGTIVYAASAARYW